MRMWGTGGVNIYCEEFYCLLSSLIKTSSENKHRTCLIKSLAHFLSFKVLPLDQSPLLCITNRAVSPLTNLQSFSILACWLAPVAGDLPPFSLLHHCSYPILYLVSFIGAPLYELSLEDRLAENANFLKGSQGSPRYRENSWVLGREMMNVCTTRGLLHHAQSTWLWPVSKPLCYQGKRRSRQQDVQKWAVACSAVCLYFLTLRLPEVEWYWFLSFVLYNSNFFLPLHIYY